MVSTLVLGWVLSLTGAAEATDASPSLPERATYEAARAKAGRSADAHVALALGCEAHGMASEKATHLARAVLLDPSHSRARGLLGFVRHDGNWMRPEEVTRAEEESPARHALFREYLGRRSRAGDRADDQYKLAAWCEEHGLTQQATAHFHRVVELNPGRDEAWKHLGFKKVNGRWIKPEFAAAEKTEREAQSCADKIWKPKLEHLKRILSGHNPSAQAEAMETLAAIEDPRAAPMAWDVFARGDEASQRVAARVFGQIEGRSASAALAMMAVFSPVANARSKAAQMLTRRDPREFARLLASLIRDEIKYKKDVAGPGSQGELLVEGKDANVKRLYTPLRNTELMPGDQIGVDRNGMSIVNRPVGGRYWGGRMPLASFLAYMQTPSALPIWGPNAATNWGSDGFSWFGRGVPGLGVSRGSPVFAGSSAVPGTAASGASGDAGGSNGNVSSMLQKAGLTESRSQEIASRIPNASSSDFVTRNNITPIWQDALQVPIGQMTFEAQLSAMVAQNQLLQDVRQLDLHNAPIRETNERVAAVLKAVSGQDHGVDRDQWIDWAFDVEGYGAPLKAAASRPPTIMEQVPLTVQPQALPIYRTNIVGGRSVGHSCFAGGTRVVTMQGRGPSRKYGWETRS